MLVSFNEKLRNFLKTLRRKGGVVNSAVVVTVA